MSAHGLGSIPKELIERLNKQVRYILHLAGTDYEGATLTEAYANLLKDFEKDDNIADYIKRKWPIPSGNVYLAQLMAHDLIQTVETGCEDAPYENLVRRPLMLETIYGRGPDVQPMLYQIRELDKSTKNRPVFRPKFKLGKFGSIEGYSKSGLDLPRSSECAAPNGSGVQSCDPGFTRREAIIADRRNDSHTILAQITAVWMLFHNYIYDRLIAQVADPKSPDIRASFMSAKRIVTASWHRVIRNDIHPIILKDVGKSEDMETDDAGFGASTLAAGTGDWLDPFTGLPSTEARVAIRCLHCLPRAHYDFSGSRVNSLSEVLQVASERLVDNINKDWIVDWSKFFDFGGEDRNKLRTRYVAGFSAGMTRGRDGTHLLRADLERVLEILSGPNVEERLLEFVSEDFIERLQAAIAQANFMPDADVDEKARVQHQQEQVTRFPPLLIKLMQEAANEKPASHLGPTGTKLLSPWLLGALEQAEQRICLTKKEKSLVKHRFIEILKITNQV